MMVAGEGSGNLYFDELPIERFLGARIDYKDDVPVATYSLAFYPHIPQPLQQVIRAHYRNLDLLERYRSNSDSELSETRSSLRTHLRTPLRAQVQVFLNEEAGRLSGRFSPNYWKAVLHEAMARDVRFCDSCLVLP